MTLAYLSKSFKCTLWLSRGRVSSASQCWGSPGCSQRWSEARWPAVGCSQENLPHKSNKASTMFSDFFMIFYGYGSKSLPKIFHWKTSDDQIGSSPWSETFWTLARWLYKHTKPKTWAQYPRKSSRICGQCADVGGPFFVSTNYEL